MVWALGIRNTSSTCWDISMVLTDDTCTVYAWILWTCTMHTAAMATHGIPAVFVGRGSLFYLWQGFTRLKKGSSDL